MEMTNTIKKHIFVLDDEPTVCEVLREILEDLNYKVSCFGDPIECLAQLGSNRCDLLITDLKMPNKDGFEVLKEVQRIAPWIPVLMITGYGNIQNAVKAMKAGAIDFMEKPLDKKNLVHKIKSIFSKEHFHSPRIRYCSDPNRKRSFKACNQQHEQ